MQNEALKRKKERKSFVTSFLKPCPSLWQATPMILGVILLIGLLQTFVSKKIISSVFIGSVLRDTFIGSVFGSISAGNPINSYIIGGELLKKGVSLFAVTAFIIAWVTVGLVQYPMERAILGKRFAFCRNVLSFILVFFISIATVITLNLLP